MNNYIIIKDYIWFVEGKSFRFGIHKNADIGKEKERFKNNKTILNYLNQLK